MRYGMIGWLKLGLFLSMMSIMPLALARSESPDADPSSHPDADIMAYQVFRLLPYGKIEGCFASFSFDKARSAQDVHADEFGGAIFQALFDFARTQDFRMIGTMSGSQTVANFVLPEDCENGQSIAARIADHANTLQHRVHIMVIDPDPEFRRLYGEQSIREWYDVGENEFALRKIAMARPCEPAGWLAMANSYLAASESRAATDVSREALAHKSLLTRSLADVLRGQDVSSVVERSFQGAELQALMAAVIQSQLKHTGC